MPALALCMIVRDEEEVLERCLASVADLVDELVVVDTGSRDATADIALRFGARLARRLWRDDFAAARNHSFRLARAPFLLWLDADDVLLPEARVGLRELKARLEKDVYYLPYDYAQDDQGRSLCTLYRERIVRNRPELRWAHPIHEHLTVGPEMTVERAEVTVTHRRTAAGAAADRDRNLRILTRALRRRAYRDSPRLHYYLAREHHDAGHDEQAAAAYRRFLELPGGWSEDRVCARQRLARCEYNLAGRAGRDAAEQRARARAEAHAARQLDARWAEPAFLLGEIALAEGQPEEAVFWCEQALRPRPEVLSPVDAFAYGLGPAVQLCLAHDRLGDVLRANLYNEVALTLRPGDAGLLHNRAYLAPRLRAQLGQAAPRVVFGPRPHEGRVWCCAPPAPQDAPRLARLPGVPLAAPLDALPFEAHSVASLLVEQPLDPARQSELLREARRVLVPGGELRVRHPSACAAGEQALADAAAAAGFVVDHGGWLEGVFTLRALVPVAARRVGFVGGWLDLRAPQYRLRVFHVDRYLRSRGYRCEIIEPARIPECDTLVFFRRFTAEEHAAMQWARELGKTVLLDLAEDLFDLPFEWYRPMIAAAHQVVCCSHRLAERVRAQTGHPSVAVIEDAVEADFARNCAYDARRTLTVGWVGMGGNARHAERLRAGLAAAGHRLVTIHDGPDADVPWDGATWQPALCACDVAVAPLDVEAQPSKSNNKVTTYMALGLPVVAARLEAYTRIVRHGENGLLAAGDEEYLAAIERLVDAGERRRLGLAGKATAAAYSLDVIGQRWADLLVPAEQPALVDIVVPTRGHPDYLAACLASLAEATDVPHRVIVVDSGEQPATGLPAGVTVVRPPRPLGFAEAVNAGAAAGRAPYLCLLNDDTIVSRGWLRPLIDTLGAGVAACNPLSNCDQGWLHDYDLSLDGFPLRPAAAYLDGAHVRLRDDPGTALPVARLRQAPGRERVYEREWVAFFCTVLPRRVWDEVGPLDEGFDGGCEDVDWCRRAARLGYRAAVNERSFVFHFGGVSRGESARQAEYRAADRRNQARLSAKYDRPLLVLHTGEAYETWSAESLERGIGGSETAAVRLGEELARLGYRVVTFGRCEERVQGGVEYLDHGRFASFAATHHADAFVVSRYAPLLDAPLRAARRYLWVHDVCAIDAADAQGDRVRRHYPRLDRVVCLSEWHREAFAAHHGVSPERIVVARNGVDPERFARPVERRRHRLIYSSSPDRGLDTLLAIFPRLRAELPDAELHVFYGFDNWDRALSWRNRPEERAWRRAIETALDQPGVVYHGRVGQARLAEELLRSDLWLYPTRFTETYCITALEAQMAGVACVCSDLGALRSTVGERGVLLPGDAYTEEYQERAVRESVALLKDRARREALAERGRAWAAGQTWQALAREWDAWIRAADAPGRCA